MDKNEFVAELEKSANDIAKQVKDITTPIDARLKQIEGQMIAGGTLDPALKSEVANLTVKHEELSKKHADFVALADGKIADLKSLGNPANGKPVSLAKHISELMTSHKGVNGATPVEMIKSGYKGPIEFDLKAVGDMSAANLTGAYFAGYQLLPGFVHPAQETHLRPFFPNLTTTFDTIRFGRETAKEGAFGMVAPGDLKPQIDYDFQLFDAPVRKIAGYFRLPEEMMKDIPYLVGMLTTRGIEDLQNTEDYQFINGDGQGQNLTGIATIATAFAAGSLKVVSPNEYDVLIAAKKQLRKLNLVPTVVMVSPENYAKMRLAKDSQGRYIFAVQPGTEAITADGTPIVQNNQIADGQFYVMDARQAQIVDREQATVRFYDQDRDNAIRNLVTCVIEERLAFPILRTQAFVKGTFSTAITALTPA